MKNETLRTFLLIAIMLLVASEFLRLLVDMKNIVGGVLSGLGVAAVYYFCGKKARAGINNQLWFLVPTLIFTVIPVGKRVWDYLYAEESSQLEKLLEITPFLLSFVVPMGLLVAVYVSLGNRLKN